MSINSPTFPPKVMVLTPRLEPHDDPTRVIGRRTTHGGTEHRYLRDSTVVVLAVLKDALVGGDNYLDSDAAIRLAGGVGPDDRVEVAPWLPEEGRLSFVTSDPRRSTSTHSRPRFARSSRRHLRTGSCRACLFGNAP